MWTAIVAEHRARHANAGGREVAGGPPFVGGDPDRGPRRQDHLHSACCEHLASRGEHGQFLADRGHDRSDAVTPRQRADLPDEVWLARSGNPSRRDAGGGDGRHVHPKHVKAALDEARCDGPASRPAHTRDHHARAGHQTPSGEPSSRTGSKPSA
jgi:hypothetical protein